MNKINANINGLNYEKLTNVYNQFKKIKNVKFGKEKNSQYDLFDIDGILFYRLEKIGLKKHLIKDFNVKCEKSFLPDESFVNKEYKIIYILEKKFQICHGSTDEKIQTAVFKYEFYKEQYPSYIIKFAYVLSDWFKIKKYLPEMRYLQKNNIKVFWGNNNNYFDELKNWLLEVKNLET